MSASLHQQIEDVLRVVRTALNTSSQAIDRDQLMQTLEVIERLLDIELLAEYQQELQELRRALIEFRN